MLLGLGTFWSLGIAIGRKLGATDDSHVPHMTGGRGRLQYYLKGSTRFGIIKVNHVLDSGVEMIK